MQHRAKSVSIPIVLALLLVFVLSLTVQAQGHVSARDVQVGPVQAQLDTGVTSINVSARDQRAALRFWTHEKLDAAPALAMPAQFGAAAVDLTSLGETSSFGPPGSTLGGAPMAGADAAASQAYPDQWLSVDEAAELLSALGAGSADSPAAADGTSQTYTAYIINKTKAVQKLFGQRTVGRLSFSTPGGTSYCSASVVSPNNIIVTAAHCVFDTPSRNAFYSNWVYTPAYRAGNAPYGTFAAQTCWVLNSWIGLSGGYSINTWADDDVAVCKMGNNSKGQSLSNLTGWLGRGWNWSYVQHFHTLGYPFNNYADQTLTDAGKYLRTCASESFQQASEVVGTGCFWSRGNSGGPFVVGYSLADVTGQVRSVYSGFFIGTQNAYGARFNSNNIVPLCSAAGC